MARNKGPGLVFPEAQNTGTAQPVDGFNEAQEGLGLLFPEQEAVSGIANSGSSSGGGAIQIDSEGNEISGNVSNIDFTGEGVTVSGSGESVTVDITGGGGSADTTQLPDGTAAEPSIRFANDQNTGIYRVDNDDIAISAGGSNRFEVRPTAVVTTVPVVVPEGSASAPSLRFTGDGNTGFYHNTDDNIAVTLAGNVQTVFRTDELEVRQDLMLTSGNDLILGGTTFTESGGTGIATHDYVDDRDYLQNIDDSAVEFLADSEEEPNWTLTGGTVDTQWEFSVSGTGNTRVIEMRTVDIDPNIATANFLNVFQTGNSDSTDSWYHITQVREHDAVRTRITVLIPEISRNANYLDTLRDANSAITNVTFWADMKDTRWNADNIDTDVIATRTYANTQNPYHLFSDNATPESIRVDGSDPNFVAITDTSLDPASGEYQLLFTTDTEFQLVVSKADNNIRSLKHARLIRFANVSDVEDNAFFTVASVDTITSDGLVKVNLIQPAISGDFDAIARFDASGTIKINAITVEEWRTDEFGEGITVDADKKPAVDTDTIATRAYVDENAGGGVDIVSEFKNDTDTDSNTLSNIRADLNYRLQFGRLEDLENIASEFDSWQRTSTGTNLNFQVSGNVAADDFVLTMRDDEINRLYTINNEFTAIIDVKGVTPTRTYETEGDRTFFAYVFADVVDVITGEWAEGEEVNSDANSQLYINPVSNVGELNAVTIESLREGDVTITVNDSELIIADDNGVTPTAQVSTITIASSISGYPAYEITLTDVDGTTTTASIDADSLGDSTSLANQLTNSINNTSFVSASRSGLVITVTWDNAGAITGDPLTSNNSQHLTIETQTAGAAPATPYTTLVLGDGIVALNDTEIAIDSSFTRDTVFVDDGLAALDFIASDGADTDWNARGDDSIGANEVYILANEGVAGENWYGCYFRQADVNDTDLQSARYLSISDGTDTGYFRVLRSKLATTDNSNKLVLVDIQTEPFQGTFDLTDFRVLAASDTNVDTTTNLSFKAAMDAPRSLFADQFAAGDSISLSNVSQTDGSNKVQIAASIDNLSDIGDVSSTTPTTGEVLKWDGTEWAPGTDNTSGATNLTNIADGAASAPSIAFGDDANTGIYRPGADRIGLTAGGSLGLDVRSDVVVSQHPIVAPDGSSTTPGYRFAGDSNTGLYQNTDNQFAATVNGSVHTIFRGDQLEVRQDLELTSGNDLIMGGTTFTEANIADTDWVKTNFGASVVANHSSNLSPTEYVDILLDNGQDSLTALGDGIRMTAGHGITYTDTSDSEFTVDVDTDVIADTDWVKAQGYVTTDTNTTYTFTSGTGGQFTVTPSGGSAQTVTTGGGGAADLTSVASGTALAPSIAHAGDSNTGIHFGADDQIDLGTNGSSRLTITTDRITSTEPLTLPEGTSTAPSISFSGDSNTGIYQNTDNQLAITNNGTVNYIFRTTELEARQDVMLTTGNNLIMGDTTINEDTIAFLNTIDSDIAPTNNQVLTYNTTNSQWEAADTQGGTDTNTTYTFASGTGGQFTVTPSDGSAQTVTTGITNLASLSDVSSTAATNNQVLTWDNANSTWEPADAQGGGATTINDLTDVDTSGDNAPSNGQILQWNSTDSQWEPATNSGGTAYTAAFGLNLSAGNAFSVDTDVIADTEYVQAAVRQPWLYQEYGEDFGITTVQSTEPSATQISIGGENNGLRSIHSISTTLFHDHTYLRVTYNSNIGYYEVDHHDAFATNYSYVRFVSGSDTLASAFEQDGDTIEIDGAGHRQVTSYGYGLVYDTEDGRVVVDTDDIAQTDQVHATRKDLAYASTQTEDTEIQSTPYSGTRSNVVAGVGETVDFGFDEDFISAGTFSYQGAGVSVFAADSIDVPAGSSATSANLNITHIIYNPNNHWEVVKTGSKANTGRLKYTGPTTSITATGQAARFNVTSINVGDDNDGGIRVGCVLYEYADSETDTGTEVEILGLTRTSNNGGGSSDASNFDSTGVKVRFDDSGSEDYTLNQNRFYEIHPEMFDNEANASVTVEDFTFLFPSAASGDQSNNPLATVSSSRSSFTISNNSESIPAITGQFDLTENATEARTRIKAALDADAEFSALFSFDTDTEVNGNIVARYVADDDDNDYSDFNFSITISNGNNGSPYLMAQDPSTEGTSTTYTVDDPGGTEITSFTSSVTDASSSDLQTVLDTIVDAINDNTETPINFSAEKGETNELIFTATQGGAVDGTWTITVNNNGITDSTAGDITFGTTVIDKESTTIYTGTNFPSGTTSGDDYTPANSNSNHIFVGERNVYWSTGDEPAVSTDTGDYTWREFIRPTLEADAVDAYIKAQNYTATLTRTSGQLSSITYSGTDLQDYFKELVRTDGQLTSIRLYEGTSNEGALVYTQTLTRTDGQLTSVAKS